MKTFVYGISRDVIQVGQSEGFKVPRLVVSGIGCRSCGGQTASHAEDRTKLTEALHLVRVLTSQVIPENRNDILQWTLEQTKKGNINEN